MAPLSNTGLSSLGGAAAYLYQKSGSVARIFVKSRVSAKDCRPAAASFTLSPSPSPAGGRGEHWCGASGPDPRMGEGGIGVLHRALTRIREWAATTSPSGVRSRVGQESNRFVSAGGI